MLFPNLEPMYINEDNPEILKRMQTSYAEAITLNQAFWSEADLKLC